MANCSYTREMETMNPDLEQVAESLSISPPAKVSAIGPMVGPGWYLIYIEGTPKWIERMFGSANPEWAEAGWNNVLIISPSGAMALRYIWPSPPPQKIITHQRATCVRPSIRRSRNFYYLSPLQIPPTNCQLHAQP